MHEELQHFQLPVFISKNIIFIIANSIKKTAKQIENKDENLKKF